MAKYYINNNSEFVIEDYNNARAFSSFLPGIAGLRGKPAWAFYVNRSQCMASFGTRNKDSAIMEFYPANTAYRRTPLEGFRTFIKDKATAGVYEPFRNVCPARGKIPLQVMIISPHELRIEETSSETALKIEAVYFTAPNEDFPALARILRIENMSSKTKELEVIDGMPKFMPFGMNEFFMKQMSRTIEAWMEVSGIDRNPPFYRLKTDARDVSKIEYIKGGNFYIGVADKGMTDKGLKPRVICDPQAVFGSFSDFTYPAAFAARNFIFPRSQRTRNITPSAFSHCVLSVPGKGKTHIYSLMGYAESEGHLKKISARVDKFFFTAKRFQNKAVISDIASSVSVFSGSREFDAYTAQTNLDNILRGGYPVESGGKKFTYVFNRKHGDLERDYNYFVLEPECYSKGNGNFRDMNQNRRLSVWMEPGLGNKDISDFYDLIQMDGYNPLLIKGEDSSGRIQAEHSEGYWIDHWTYNLDLVESCLALFPEKKKELLFGGRDYLVFDSPYRVKPRNLRYVTDEKGVLRQYYSVFLDEEKRGLIDSRDKDKNWVRKGYGKGDIFRTTLAGKMLILIVNKMASLDASGRGIEMEADRPGWCDSLNGLPGIMGSSTPETAELLRLVEFLREGVLESGKTSFSLQVEVNLFMTRLASELRKNLKDKSSMSDHRYWDASNRIKESYRDKVRFGVSGKEKRVDAETLTVFLSFCSEKLKKAIAGSYGKAGVPHTYFINKALFFDRKGRVSRFSQRPLPLFLEGSVRIMRVEKNEQRAKELYDSVRKSPLYDRKLGMYRLNAPISGEPLEIGRSRIFEPGWLENESVWLHMEYKYLLEVLRKGLLPEFYDDFKKALIPFQPPQRYGRSVFENSSFIVSSAFFDPGLHGTGFVARLSGATAEFLSMLQIMNLGRAPFSAAGGRLIFKPEPALDRTLFSKEERAIEFRFRRGKRTVDLPKHSYAFSIFKNTLVIYENPAYKNTYGDNCAKPSRFTLYYANGKIKTSGSSSLGPPDSLALREGRIDKVSILLG